MSANQPPFPPYPDQRGYAAPAGPPQSNSQFFPPQLRKGQGQGPATNPYGQAQAQQGQPAPDVSFNDDATQAFQPSQTHSPGGFSQLRAAGQFQAGPSQPNQFSPSGTWNNNGNSGFQPPAGSPAWPQLSPSKPLGTAGQFGQPDVAAGSTSKKLIAAPGQFGAPAPQFGSATRQLGNTGALPGAGATGQLPGAYSGDTGMLTLNQAVKVVRIPVAGKPGEFKTGILPVLQQPSTGALPPPASANAQGAGTKRRGKMFLLLALVLVVVLGSASFFLLHLGSSGSSMTAQQSGGTGSANAGANAAATAAVQATATAQSSLVAADSLASPIHNWAQGTDTNAKISFTFKEGAYHIRQEGAWLGYALMPAVQLPKNYTYTLTMQNVDYNKGDQNSLSFYCMIMNYQSYSNNKAQSFYALRVNNGANVSYEFDKYDNRNTGANGNPWTQIFPDPNNSAGTGKGNGKEFRGPHQPNVYSVTEHNGNFTFSVNGVKIGTAKDTAFTGGALGMGVNQSGTEAAFSNLTLSNN